MPIIRVRDNQNNRWKRKAKKKQTKETTKKNPKTNQKNRDRKDQGRWKGERGRAKCSILVLKWGQV